MGFQRGPKTSKSIVLYAIGIALVVAGAIVVLQGTGLLASIPNFILWAIVLVVLGLGTIAGVSNASR